MVWGRWCAGWLCGHTSKEAASKGCCSKQHAYHCTRAGHGTKVQKNLGKFFEPIAISKRTESILTGFVKNAQSFLNMNG
jgi:hypothetical protein